MVAEQREVRKHVDVDRLGSGEIEKRVGLCAVAASQLLGDVLHAGVRAFHRPKAARPLLEVRPLVLEVMAVADVGDVHRLLVGRVLVVGHALLGVSSGKRFSVSSSERCEYTT